MVEKGVVNVNFDDEFHLELGTTWKFFDNKVISKSYENCFLYLIS